MLLRTDDFFDMHDSPMSHIGMESEQSHHHNGENYGSGDGWVEINGYSSSQHQSPAHEFGGFGFMHPTPHSLPSESTFTRMAPPPPPPPPPTTTHQQLLPLIMPSHPTWPSMLTNPAGYQAQAAALTMPPISASATVKPAKLPSIHHTSSPRKTLTDDDRRRMCRYHEENPSVKQTEIGAMFGVERSTVSKVLRQKEKYLFPEDRSLSPVKKAKGKFPDIERALSNWVRNSQKQGMPLTDAAIKEKARFFATTVGNTESHVKVNSTSWLEKFKQKNGIPGGKLLRRASETNISTIGSLNPGSAGTSGINTPNGISPTSPGELLSPLSGTKSDMSMKTDHMDGYLDYGNTYRQSSSQSTTSLNTGYTDSGPSPFSVGPTSPTTPFSFSPDTTCAPYMPSHHSRLPPPSTFFQRPRSQTFPMLGIDPSYISSPQLSEPQTPKYHPSATAPVSALETPNAEEAPLPFAMDAVSSPTLHHRSSNGSMVPPPSSHTPIQSGSALSSPPPGGSSPSSATRDDARRALDTLLSFLSSAPQGLDQNDYMLVLKLTEKLRLQEHQNHDRLPGGLHRIAEQENEPTSSKTEHSMISGV